MGQSIVTSSFNGYFEGIRHDGWATGWIHRTDGNCDKASVRITIDGVEASQVAADQFREDLLAADLPDPGCAFLYRIPANFIDAAEHRIDIDFADNGLPLPNSPQHFSFHSPAAARNGVANLIPNANFARWPGGASVMPDRRLGEGPEGWLVDFWRGVSPGVTLSIDRPTALALPPGAFAMRITAPEPISNYFRLIVPLSTDRLAAGRYHCSLGLSRPPAGAGGDLHLANLFLAAVDDVTVTHVANIRRNVRVSGTQRLHGMVLEVNEMAAASFGNGINPALVMEFQGQGTLQLFEPDLCAGAPLRPSIGNGVGSFEDPNIVGQIDKLALGTLWSAGGQRAKLPVPLQRTIVSAALPFIQIVIPVFNAGADVDELVASLIEHGEGPFELLFADDASEPFTAQRLQRWTQIDPRIRLLRSDVNLGYTRNINRALQSTVASHVVLLNSDTVVTKNWLRRLFEAMSASADVGAVGPLSNAASWQSVPIARDKHGQWSVNPLISGIDIDGMAAAVADLSDMAFPAVPLLNGFCTLFRRDALEAVGWFDDDTFPEGYGEENDLCIRLGQAGWLLRIADHAYVHHKKSRSFGPERRKKLTGVAGKALRSRHPSVAIDQLEAAMQGCEPINRLRARLTSTLCTEKLL
jgi:GT2 family glycosyltransferase